MEKKMRKAWVLLVAASMAWGLFASANLAGAETLTLKVSHQFAAGDVRDRLARVFGDMVTEKTNGEIKFRYYPAKSLFKPKEQWDALREGALDMTVLPLDYASGKVPELSITLMPCTVTSVAQGIGWRNKPIGEKVEAAMLDGGVRNLVWAWFDGGIGSKVKQIKVPQDVQGTKLRAAGKRFEFMMGEAGASITSMPSSEIYHALSTGVLDTVLTSSASFVSYKLNEVVQYMNVPRDHSIWYMAENLIISEKTWERLTPAQQKAFLDVAEWMHENWIVDNLAPSVDDLIKVFSDSGVELHYMTQEEFDTWAAYAKDTAWKNFAENVEGGQELLDLALAALK